MSKSLEDRMIEQGKRCAAWVKLLDLAATVASCALPETAKEREEFSYKMAELRMAVHEIKDRGDD
jgi:hypothetical protein